MEGMCSVLLLQSVLADASLGVLFVRDEEFERGGSPPEVRPEAPHILAPRDPRAGGTWFGVSGAGFVAGLVNRKGDPEPADGRSRGKLLAMVLGAAGMAEAMHLASEEVKARAYGGCRIFCGDGKTLEWIDLPVSGHPSPSHQLEPGSWLMQHTRHPEPAPAEVVPSEGETAETWLSRVGDLIAEHGPEGRPLCVHGDHHGSVDMSFVALGGDGRPVVFRHLQGAPCSGDLSDYSGLLAGLSGAERA